MHRSEILWPLSTWRRARCLVGVCHEKQVVNGGRHVALFTLQHRLDHLVVHVGEHLLNLFKIIFCVLYRWGPLLSDTRRLYSVVGSAGVDSDDLSSRWVGVLALLSSSGGGRGCQGLTNKGWDRFSTLGTTARVATEASTSSNIVLMTQPTSPMSRYSENNRHGPWNNGERSV